MHMYFHVHVHVVHVTCGNLVCTCAPLSGQASSPADRTLLPATPTGLCQVEPVQRLLCGEPLTNDTLMGWPRISSPSLTPSLIDTLMEWHLISCLLPPVSSSFSFHSLPPCPASLSYSIFLSLPHYISPSLPSPTSPSLSPLPPPSFSPCSRHGVLFNQRILWSYWTTPTKTPMSVPMPCAVSTHSRKLQL